jgi:hypothetical protein
MKTTKKHAQFLGPHIIPEQITEKKDHYCERLGGLSALYSYV